jgi:hypothetical protein
VLQIRTRVLNEDWEDTLPWLVSRLPTQTGKRDQASGLTPWILMLSVITVAIPSTSTTAESSSSKFSRAWQENPNGSHKTTLESGSFCRCRLQLIRSATQLGPDFAFNSFSNPPFFAVYSFSKCALAPPLRASIRPRSLACCSPFFPSCWLCRSLRTARRSADEIFAV